jgi:hypothetical protein
MPPLRETRETLDMIFDAKDSKAAAQTDTALQAAPGAGNYLIVTDIIISANGTANAIKLVENTASSSDRTPLFYILPDTTWHIALKTPIKLTENVNLGYSSTVADKHTVQVSGYTLKT